MLGVIFSREALLKTQRKRLAAKINFSLPRDFSLYHTNIASRYHQIFNITAQYKDN